MSYLLHTSIATDVACAPAVRTQNPQLVNATMAAYEAQEQAKNQRLRLAETAARASQRQQYIQQPDGTVIPRTTWTPDSFDGYHY